MTVGSRLRSERGDTLPEVIITLVIISIAVTGLLAGLATGSTASASHRVHARADALVREAAERLKDRSPTGVPYVACASSYVVAPSPPLGDIDVKVLEVEHWNGADWAATCTVDKGLQRITVAATSDDGVVESVTLVKRKM